jgi:hypothetical protein
MEEGFMARDGANRDFEANVAGMLHAETTDGRLEVAEAVATTSHKVTVDVTTVPFTTVPANLFTLTFNDPTIGIDDESLMRAFKAQLERRLHKIAATIEQNVPANPALDIELVAQFVFAALGES